MLTAVLAFVLSSNFFKAKFSSCNLCYWCVFFLRNMFSKHTASSHDFCLVWFLSVAVITNSGFCLSEAHTSGTELQLWRMHFNLIHTTSFLHKAFQPLMSRGLKLYNWVHNYIERHLVHQMTGYLLRASRSSFQVYFCDKFVIVCFKFYLVVSPSSIIIFLNPQINSVKCDATNIMQGRLNIPILKTHWQ